MKKHTLIFIFFSLITGAVCAQDNTPRADVRQHNQRDRIAEGRSDGDLTHKETTALNHQQRHIRKAERRAKADGDVTAAERRKLERKQDRANRNIRKAKHNNIEAN